MPFSIGDIVKPKKEWEVRDERNYVVPSGKVTRIEPWGNGQVLYVGTDRRPFVSGVFEKVEGV